MGVGAVTRPEARSSAWFVSKACRWEPPKMGFQDRALRSQRWSRGRWVQEGKGASRQGKATNGVAFLNKTGGKTCGVTASLQVRASVCVPFQGRETARGAAGRPPKGQLQRTERRGRHPAPGSVGSRGRVPWPSRLI